MTWRRRVSIIHTMATNNTVRISIPEAVAQELIRAEPVTLPGIGTAVPYTTVGDRVHAWMTGNGYRRTSSVVKGGVRISTYVTTRQEE